MELIGALGIYLRISVNSTNIFELNSMDFCNLQMVSRLVGTYNIWGWSGTININQGTQVDVDS